MVPPLPIAFQHSKLKCPRKEAFCFTVEKQLHSFPLFLAKETSEFEGFMNNDKI